MLRGLWGGGTKFSEECADVGGTCLAKYSVLTSQERLPYSAVTTN